MIIIDIDTDENTYSIFDDTDFAPGRPVGDEMVLVQPVEGGYEVTRGIPQYAPILAIPMTMEETFR
jgi:hypothetical protein